MVKNHQGSSGGEGGSGGLGSLRAVGELGSDGRSRLATGGLNEVVPLVGLVLAGADIGVGLVDVVLNKRLLAELEGSIVH